MSTLKSGIGQNGSLKFHQIHGDNILLANNDRSASRGEGNSKALAFSSRPIGVKEMVNIRIIDARPGWKGALSLGITNKDPATFDAIPKYLCPDMVSAYPGACWAKAMSESDSSKNNIINFHVRENGEMCLAINGKVQVVFLVGIDIRSPMYVVADVYGSTVGIEFLDNSDGTTDRQPAQENSAENNTPLLAPSPPLTMPQRSRSESVSMPVHNVDGLMEFLRAKIARHSRKVFILGISGGSGSGKTYIAQQIYDRLRAPWVAMISLDNFYRDFSNVENLENHKDIDFDHPNALDFDLLWAKIQKLLQGEQVEIPEYEFKSRKRLEGKMTQPGIKVLILEGIFALHKQSIRDVMDLKLFVHTAADVRLSRRIRRDIRFRNNRSESVDTLLDRYDRFVRTGYENYIKPTKQYADMIVSGEKKSNKPIIDLICDAIHWKMMGMMDTQIGNSEKPQKVYEEGQPQSHQHTYDSDPKTEGFWVVDHLKLYAECPPTTKPKKKQEGKKEKNSGK